MKKVLALLAAVAILVSVRSWVKADKNKTADNKPPAVATARNDNKAPPPNPPVPPMEAVGQKDLKDKDRTTVDLGSVNAFGQTEEQARMVAQAKARERVLAFLAKQEPPIEFEPSLEFLQTNNFVKDEVMTVEVAKETDGPTRHECTVKVELSPALFGEILKQDHQSIQSDRQWLAGKILAVLLALVLAVGGYFYIDEATKGFYTVLLRIGAASLVAGVGLAVWLVMH